jgi:hypothetical protein
MLQGCLLAFKIVVSLGWFVIKYFEIALFLNFFITMFNLPLLCHYR